MDYHEPQVTDLSPDNERPTRLKGRTESVVALIAIVSLIAVGIGAATMERLSSAAPTGSSTLVVASSSAPVAPTEGAVVFLWSDDPGVVVDDGAPAMPGAFGSGDGFTYVYVACPDAVESQIEVFSAPSSPVVILAQACPSSGQEVQTISPTAPVDRP